MNIHDQLTNGERLLGDTLSVGVLLGAISNMLPSVATILTIVWMAIRIIETQTVRRLFGRPAGGKDDE